MDRSEPAFIPQWLKSTGSVTAGGTNQAGSFLRSDEQSVLKHSRNKSSVSSSEHDMTRSFVHERTTSAYFRRSSSSKDSINSRSYSSVNRSYRDKQWDDLHEFQDKEKSFMDELKHPEGSVLRHSQSMISRKSNGFFARKVVSDPINTTSNNHISSNGHLLPGSTVPSSSQNNFARDFPSLITEQGQGSELRRIPSPIQASSSVSQDGCTSSLAEVPVLGGSGSATTGSLSSQQMTTASSGIKMAEAVAQSPSRARTPPQISVETQRLQELAIKQSRQLIPMTPSMPKPLSPSPLEKSKAKSGIQQSQFFPPQHAQHVNQTTRGGPVRVDLGKTSGLGKLQVLKSSRELNGVSLNVKDSPSPKNGISSPLSQTPSAASLHGSNRNPFSNQNPAGLERKVQSRNDFFNLIKKKSSVSSPSVLETSNDDSIEEAVATASLDSSGSDTMGDDGAKITTNGECNKEALVNHMEQEQEQANFYISPLDEKEAAFMRSLGWESSGEDESITEDEINSFLEYAKTRPISELQGFWFLRLQNGRGN